MAMINNVYHAVRYNFFLLILDLNIGGSETEQAPCARAKGQPNMDAEIRKSCRQAIKLVDARIRNGVHRTSYKFLN